MGFLQKLFSWAGLIGAKSKPKVKKPRSDGRITVRIAGTMRVLNAEDWEEVTTPSVKKKLHGFRYDEEEMAEYIDDGSSAKAGTRMRLQGGSIEFEYDAKDNQLWIVTEFIAPRKLNEKELSRLVYETQNQWSDGMGSNIEVQYAERKSLDLELYSTDQRIVVEQY